MENREIKDHNEKYHEETAAEVAPHHTFLEEKVYPEVKKSKLTARILGYTGLILAVISLFFYPYVLGIIAIVLGFISQRKGEITFGAWAIAIGALSLIISLFIVPIF
ncbi:hypothetical protein [Bacillus massiliigorillae]|uniref:hypothetical protein n=1 Tax=Bacillus massiliigorillae TaxID=1243664 RepID=UPI0003A0D642|nr:hypothetical protein [Bacillus massiliigorillae]